jgi:oxygen-independent coproporphyrinogen III oxidase
MADYSIYLHVPFCIHRCAYCDFNTYAGLEEKIPAYVRALCKEIDIVSQESGQRLPVHTIFFGGGTPSLLSPEQIESVLAALSVRFNLDPDVEITLEANPGTVSLDFLRAVRGMGVNRLSFGMQSANPFELRFLTRQHRLEDVQQAVEWSRRAGFDNLSLDLIFGLPNQNLLSWQNSVRKALALMPDHISLYSLTVEKGTPLFRWVEHGLVESPDDDLAADMYDWCIDFLPEAGFTQYEISNWARSDADGALKSSRHNLQYWLNQPYLGFGAGAHGSAAGARIANVNGVQAYIDRFENPALLDFPRGPATKDFTPIDRETEMGETMMVGLRLTLAGVSDRSFQERFGVSLEEAYPRQIQHFSSAGLLEWTDEQDKHLRLTRRGRLLGNRVFREFI